MLQGGSIISFISQFRGPMRILVAVTLALAFALSTTAILASAAQAGSPTVVGNFLVDQDQGLQFSDNKQNEPAITRDPLTGVLVAGANDELEEIGRASCRERV